MTVCRGTRAIMLAEDISMDAKAMLLYMIVDNLVLDNVKALRAHLGMGKYRLYRIIRELIAAEYVYRQDPDEMPYKPLRFTKKTLRIIRGS